MSPFNIHDEIKLNLNEQTILIKTAASKIVYKELRNRTITPPTAQLKFNTKFVDDVLEWKEIYSLPFRATLDTKSREFQYKLLNRCLVTNAFLFKVGLLWRYGRIPRAPYYILSLFWANTKYNNVQWYHCCTYM